MNALIAVVSATTSRSGLPVLGGGIGGYVIGTVLAVTLGPRLAGVIVLPMPILALWAVGISVGIAMVASYFPARRAARLDPCATFQEV